MNILSLGAGFDTTYFWLKGANADLDEQVTYVEIDFKDVVTKKSQTIRQS